MFLHRSGGTAALVLFPSRLAARALYVSSGEGKTVVNVLTMQEVQEYTRSLGNGVN